MEDSLEVEINREIRDYTESVFFGLNMRQFIFSLLAMGAAVFLYFTFDNVGTEARTWICMIGAAPFVLLGFVKYQGMTFERLARAWLVSEVLTPRELVFKPTNIYYEALRPALEVQKKEIMRRHD